MMITENRHLADNATLNKHRKATSEAYTRELTTPVNHTLLHHLPVRHLRESCQSSPTARYFTPSPSLTLLHSIG